MRTAGLGRGRKVELFVHLGHFPHKRGRTSAICTAGARKIAAVRNFGATGEFAVDARVWRMLGQDAQTSEVLSLRSQYKQAQSTYT